MRERERDRERETERQRDRDRETETERERQRGEDTERQINTFFYLFRAKAYCFTPISHVCSCRELDALGKNPNTNNTLLLEDSGLFSITAQT